jgi:catechol 2,3-dioxygenase-like lactoylglutathione lyase family enzyme
MRAFTPGAVLSAVLLLSTQPAWTQLAAPNEMGVTIGHVHLNVRDLDESRGFYVALGGTATRLGTAEVVSYPGVLFVLSKAQPSGPMEGSSVNHIGFVVKDGRSLMAALKERGLKIASNGTDWRGGYVYSPDGVKIEIIDRPSLAVAIQFDQVHFFVADPGPHGGPAWSELQAWYSNVFGAHVRTSTLTPPTPGNLASAPMSASEISGTNLRFSPVDAVTVPTKGRAMDHVGFEVSHLEAFCQQLSAKGVHFDVPYSRRSDLGFAFAFLTDPKGTSIELTEGLGKLPAR